MNKKQKIIISIVGITIVMLALLGLTYGYYLTRIDGNTNTNSISITTSDLKISYDDGNNVFLPVESILPGYSNSDLPKTFSVTNNGNSPADYSIIFDEVTNDFFYESDLQWELQKLDNDTGQYNKVSSGFVRNMLSNNYQKQIIYVDGRVAVGKTDYFRLIFSYIDSGIDQSVDMNKNLMFRVNIIEKTTNVKQAYAELAYQNYIIEAKKESLNINETDLLDSIKSYLISKNFTSDDVIILNNNVLTGNVAKVFSSQINPMQIGDIINYNSPSNTSIENWYVLGVDEDGNLLITHDIISEVTSDYITSDYVDRVLLKDKYSYETAEQILDEKTQRFVDGTIGIKARNIRIEDIDKLTGYNPYNVGTKSTYSIGKKYKDGTIREYRNKVTISYTSDGVNALGSNGVLDITPAARFLPYGYEEGLIINNSDSTYSVVTNYYSYYPQTLTESNSDPIIGIVLGDKLYNMLFRVESPKDYGYYISSPYVSVKSGEAHWGIRTYDKFRITGNHWWNSSRDLTNQWTIGMVGFIKGVVSIANNDKVTFKYNSTNSDGVNIFDIEVTQ